MSLTYQSIYVLLTNYLPTLLFFVVLHFTVIGLAIKTWRNLK